MQTYPFVEAILEHAAQRPTAPALVWRGEQVTYGELVALAARIRSDPCLEQRSADEATGILAKKSPQSVALVLGCLMARRPFLLPSVDLGATTLQALLETTGCHSVLATGQDPDATYARLVTHLVPSPAAAATAAGPLDRSPASPDETTFMLTTSGSTGLPKIVPLTAGAVDRFTDWAGARFGLGPEVNVLNYAPLNFDLCLLDIWATLRAGGCVVLVDHDQAASPRYLVALLASVQVHVVQAVPMLYQLLLEATTARGMEFAGVRQVLFTGDSLPRRTLEALPGLFPNAALCNVYGCTETNDSFLCEVDEAILAGSGPVPIGDPLPGVSALIMADDSRVLEGAGTGELWVSTPFQTPGYLNDDRGRGKFVRLRHAGAQRTWFRTGDLVRRDSDGAITLVGRNDFQLKVRGVAVNLQEVERTLLDHEGLVEAAVVSVPDQVAGNRLHAMVRRRPGASLNSLMLREYCAARLPRAAIPSTSQITDEPLPRTPTGKVDRQRIRAPIS